MQFPDASVETLDRWLQPNSETAATGLKCYLMTPLAFWLVETRFCQVDAFQKV